MQINFNINIDDRIIHFFKRSFTKRNSIIMVIVAIFFTGIITLTAQSLEWVDFQPGDPVSSDEINTRFNSLRDTLQDETLPVGTIMAWHKDFANTPALNNNWMKCNGQPIDDEESPYDGQIMPNLNHKFKSWNTSGSFLRGAHNSGIWQNDTFQGHYHRFSEGVRDGGSNSRNSSTISTGANRAKIFQPIQGQNGYVRYGNETRPVNMTVVWIMKIK